MFLCLFAFQGLSQGIRESLLRAILGNNSNGGSITVNTERKCYVGLSSTNPETSVTEPTDNNYKRILIGSGSGSGGSASWYSDYLTITGAQAVNSGIQKEIKFNRSLGVWTGTYPYFFLSSAETGTSGLMAWGELTEPITVSAKNVVPLFEEDKFRLYFPKPSEVESLVDAAATADSDE